ncbi:hypothetical protein N9O99_00330 [Schleiferiaceae bacterium]|nr:hypothetical protein [Schleiferiaceae bacterium]
MIAIIDRLLKALISLYVLSALNERGIDVLQEYFYLAILYQLSLFAYRPFALAKNIPLRREIYYYLIWLFVLLFIAYQLEIEMYWLLLFAPLQMIGYYVESKNAILYYLTNIGFVICLFLVFGETKLMYMVLILGNIFALLAFGSSSRFLQYTRVSLLKYSGPLILNSIAILLYTRIDILILDYFSHNQTNEVYLMSVRLFDYCAMLVSVVLNYSLIKLMNNEKSWLYSPRTVMGFVLLGTVIMSVSTSLLSQYFEYNSGIFLIYLLSLPFVALGLIRNNYLMKISRTGVVLRFSVIGVLLMVVLGIIGYLTLGITGLALSTLIVQISLILLSWDFITKALAAKNHEIS